MIFEKRKQQSDILDFIKSRKEVAQSDIVEHFTANIKSTYSNKDSARSSISLILKKLEVEGYIVKRKDEESRSAIKPNIWSAR